MEKLYKKQIKSKIDHQIPDSDVVLTSSFSEKELNGGVLSMKKGKAEGLDNNFVEEANDFGPKAKSWLQQRTVFQ